MVESGREVPTCGCELSPSKVHTFVIYVPWKCLGNELEEVEWLIGFVKTFRQQEMRPVAHSGVKIGES